MPAGWAAAAAAVVGTVASQDASRKAAHSQADAANAANATQDAQYAQTRADNMPWMDRGNAAGDQLQYLLGIGGNNGNATSPYTLNDFRGYDSRIAPDGYTIPGQEADAKIQYNKYINGGYGTDQNQIAKDFGFIPKSADSNPGYGSLLRKFSSADLANDVPYQTGMQFGLDQGMQGLNRQAAANGSLNSGATLKALTRFGNDYGNTKAGEAYNRFTTDNNNIYNRLAGVAGTGQVANAQVASSGMNAANQIGANQIGVGNARAASSIANGNSLSGAIGQGVNAYNQYNALNNNGFVPNSGGVNSVYGSGSGMNYTGGTNEASYWQG